MLLMLKETHLYEMHQLFLDLRNEFNQTFVIVSHDQELAKVTDRVLTIKDGIMV
mgnify:CR=1 FL=1